MRRIETPRFLSDLYRDLRDRRLLIPIAALLVGLVAVPVALSSGSEEPAPPPAAAAVDTADATQVQSAVLADSTGIRNYRKRLEALKNKNPFKQQFVTPSASQVGIEESTDLAASTQSAGTGPVLSPSDAADLSASAPSRSGARVGGGDPGSISPVGPAEPTTITKPVKPDVRFYAGRVDLTVGPLGQAKKLRGVKPLEMLPSQQKPVVAFFGLTADADRAIFVLSRDVTMTDGDGECIGRAGGVCQFIELAPDDQRFIHLADGSIYRLRVLDTDVVRVPDPRK